ncbi:hypothetical protein Droror1_Dr00014324, partial [Drosera rotundifolia]
MPADNGNGVKPLLILRRRAALCTLPSLVDLEHGLETWCVCSDLKFGFGKCGGTRSRVREVEAGCSLSLRWCWTFKRNQVGFDLSW